MRIGKVKLDVKLEYVVDLDNPTMIAHAKDWIWDDLDNILCDEAYTLMVTEDAPDCSEADIHSGLLEDSSA